MLNTYKRLIFYPNLINIRNFSYRYFLGKYSNHSNHSNHSNNNKYSFLRLSFFFIIVTIIHNKVKKTKYSK